MKFRWIVICLILLALPAFLYAKVDERVIKIEGDAFGVVDFDHKEHFNYLEKRLCTTCHQKIFYLDRSKNPVFSMRDMEEGKACGACHNGNLAFDVKESCSSCHPTKDIAFEVPDAGNVTFSHDIHTGMFGCSSCHPDLFIPGPENKAVTMDAMAEGESCGACHEGNTAFSVEESCDSCHQM